MILKNEALFLEQRRINDDPYGKAVVDYAERWANLMEERMQDDVSLLSSIAKEASHDANTDGITGFMYGCAVQILSTCWAHGEALRIWHNAQFGASKANETPGAVVNPAIITIDTEKAGQ